ncbi:MAG: complex I subunit 5 family protein [Armatimonadota bacterium]|jgi:hydrogenase-4 component B
MVEAAQLSVELIFGLLLAGAVAGVVLSRWARLCGWVCSLAVAGAAGAAGWLGALVWGASPVDVSLGSLGAAPVAFHFTRLNLIFVWLVLGLGLLATVYSVRYIEHSAAEEGTPAQPVMRYYPLLMLFLGSMTAVVCMPNLLSFFIAWSIMSLSGLALILHEYHKPEVLAAGIKFALFTLIGNTAIFVAIMLLYNASGSFSFEAAQETMGGMFAAGSWMPHLVFGLLAFGFLTKLGIYPMGDWLPDAHPAAPSPVSALLSGVMIKLAAYDIAHTSIELMAGGAGAGAMMAWGMVLAALGGLSVLLGGAAAAANNDTKRLLAYSSVSQSGYILMCLGVSIAFVPVDPRLAGLAFVAAIVFVIADGMHKSLMFLTAGSMLHATGTRDLLQLGGLGERMPSTKVAAIAGGLSLGGIPLTAGFIAKWLLLQATLQGSSAQPLLVVYMLVVVLGSILAMAYALKYVGAAFLGAPADPRCCEATEEVPGSMRVPQLALVAGLIATGLWPALMAGPAAAAWLEMMGLDTPLIGVEGGLLLIGGPGEGLVGGFVPAVIFVLIAAAALVAWGLSRVGGASTREVPSWQSGLDIPLAVTRLPASGWFWPFTPLLRSVYREIRLPAALNPAASTASKAVESAAGGDAGEPDRVLAAADGGE